MTALKKDYPGDGRHIGWCVTCGADVFNGPRHRCPKRINKRALALIIAAKVYVAARLALRASSNGTLNHKRNEKAAAEKFDELEKAIAAHNDGTTNGVETKPLQDGQRA